MAQDDGYARLAQGMAKMADHRWTRRRFLRASGLGAVAFLAGCAAATVRRPGPSVPPSATAFTTPSPTPSPTSSPTAQSSPSPSPKPDLRTRIGQMLLVGFRGLTVDDQSLIVQDIRDRGLGGVVLFDFDTPTNSPVRNVQSPAQLKALVAALKSAVAAGGSPLLVSIDEEGGRVARLDERHGFPATESAAALGARNDPAYTRQRSAVMGATLASMGINLNLAPVVDLNVNPTNPIIGALDRSFSADPAIVTAQALAFIAGQHESRIQTALKHFPGHGSSTGDTHLGVVDVTSTWTDVELQPFASIVAQRKADTILTAHVFNANLDPDYPATLSRATVTGILRGRLGYDGVVISDDLQMGAIRKAFGYPEAVALAIDAGVDILTIANQQVVEEGIVARTIEIIAGHVGSGRLTEERIDESWARIQALKARVG